MLEFYILFLVFLCPALVRADYTIDDSNYSVLKFSENPAGPVWGPFGSDTGEVLQIRLPNGTMETVDATQCYDGTYTYAACSTSNNCAVQFSFTGSGITIYVLQAGPQGMSASLSIDSGIPTTATLGAPPPPQYYIPHVTLFNVQNIPSGTHSAVMTVLDWNGGFSGMMLDYIDVNQAQVAGPTTSSAQAASPSPSGSSNPTSSFPSASTSSTGTQTSQQSSSGTQTVTGTPSVASVASVFSSHLSGGTAIPSSTASGNGTLSTNPSSFASKTNVSAIVGGTVGGVGLLAALALAFFCYRRRSRNQYLESLNQRPSPLLQPEAGFTAYDAGNVDPFGPTMATRPLQSWTGSETGSTPNPAVQDHNSSNPGNYSHVRGTSSGNDSFMPISIAAASATPQERDTSDPSPLVQPAMGLAPVVYANEKSRLAVGQEPLGPGNAGPSPADLPGARPNAILTDEQADFVNSLFNNNVPAPVIARVIERMVANPQGVIGANDPELRAWNVGLGNIVSSSQPQPLDGTAYLPTMSDIGDGETTIGTAPPSYDYAQAQR